MPLGLLKYGLSQDFPFEKDPDLPLPTELKRQYDVVIIGGGGHGVATAYYLANIMVLPTSRYWKRVIWVVATRRETRPSFALIT